MLTGFTVLLLGHHLLHWLFLVCVRLVCGWFPLPSASSFPLHLSVRSFWFSQKRISFNWIRLIQTNIRYRPSSPGQVFPYFTHLHTHTSWFCVVALSLCPLVEYFNSESLPCLTLSLPRVSVDVLCRLCVRVQVCMCLYVCLGVCMCVCGNDSG